MALTNSARGSSACSCCSGSPNRAHYRGPAAPRGPRMNDCGLNSKIGSIHGFERKRNSLTAADAECDDAFFNAIAFHRMQQTGRENRAGRAYRVTVRDCTTFYVYYVRVQTEVLRDRNRYRCESLV